MNFTQNKVVVTLPCKVFPFTKEGFDAAMRRIELFKNARLYGWFQDGERQVLEHLAVDRHLWDLDAAAFVVLDNFIGASVVVSGWQFPNEVSP